MKKIVVALSLMCGFLLVSTTNLSAAAATYTAGGKIGIAIEDGGVGPVFGGHLLYNFSLGEAGIISFYPSADAWFAFNSNDHRYEYIRDGIRYYYNDETIFAMDFNFDCKYSFPLPSRVPIKPYIGLGLSPGFDSHFWSDANNPDHSYTDGNFGMNFFCGVDFGAAKMAPFLEFRGKFGSHVDPFTIAFGLNFPL